MWSTMVDNRFLYQGAQPVRLPFGLPGWTTSWFTRVDNSWSTLWYTKVDNLLVYHVVYQVALQLVNHVVYQHEMLCHS